MTEIVFLIEDAVNCHYDDMENRPKINLQKIFYKF